MGAVSIQTLAREMGLDRTTLGRNLQPLERDGLVTVEVDDLDRRGRSIALTELGRARLTEAYPFWRNAQSSFSERYGADLTEAMNTSLVAISMLKLPNRY